MNTTIALLRLNRIDFQIDENNVLISCFLQSEKEEFHQSYYITHREMNRIIGELQSFNDDLSIYDEFRIIQLNEHEFLYSLDLTGSHIQNNYLPQIEAQQFSDKIKKIRA